MARHWRIRYAGAKYHLTGRGNGRAVIFDSAADSERFLEQLDHALAADEVVLYAYVLMPNHYHLFVETPLGNVQRFMQRLNTAYGMYFRFKHARPGHCFQGRYGAKLVGGDEYLLRLTRYIHLNPVKTQRCRELPVAEQRVALQAYAWSSYRGYAGLGPTEARVNYRWLTLLGRRGDKARRSAYGEYVEQTLVSEDEVLGAALRRSAYAIGDERFAEETEADIRGARLAKAVVGGDVVWPEKPRKSLEEVTAVVFRELQMSADELKRHGRAVGPRKGMALELLCRYAAASQREVARVSGFGHESGVGKQRRLLRERLRADDRFARMFQAAVQRVETVLKS